ncbi:MAG TPA: 4Fe-4S dicluster domain-containing protein [Methylomirabilota bacterium]|jgi:Fe-S-cluster-containing dehydrogenase component/formate-dependent nitrite reductase membrane component NrfD|nr:4Fe-4S dicluster domain-containing protein [Methylomirabilota bacterium]
MRYGFVIDQTRCIGCHACTVACKEENRVPLGTFRTWVKYVEKGEFPNTRRHFAVLRCNHCDNAPCVTICPTVALYRRPDGIVDFDRDRCIGCKSCMQACPYDALYMDPDTHTAAKCHFCAHRVERGLEPACVIVCPERAILTGDLDDPESEVARVIAREQVAVRKPEQGTRPKLFYVGADQATLAPTLQHVPGATLWGQRADEPVSLAALAGGWQPPRSAAATPKPVEALGRVVYDAPHEPRPWGWRVAAYLWTKSVAAGAALAAAAGALGGASAATGLHVPLVALVFLLLTAGLLIVDLKRPDRFHYLLLRPNPRSWLVLGAWILLAFGAVLGVFVVAAGAGAATVTAVLAGPLVILALGAAGYSAFLFGQAEGRDFWQSPLVLPHLLVSAVTAGAAVALLLTPPSAALRGLLLVGLGLGFLLVLAECYTPHPNTDAGAAARIITEGRLSRLFWGGVVAVGTVIPALLLIPASGAAAALAGLLALVGLYLWEDCWVRAGQAVPLS